MNTTTKVQQVARLKNELQLLYLDQWSLLKQIYRITEDGCPWQFAREHDLELAGTECVKKHMSDAQALVCSCREQGTQSNQCWCDCQFWYTEGGRR